MYNYFVQIRFATRTGMCPICHKRPRARWKDDGSLRVTCGHAVCYHKWLPGGKQQGLDNSEISDTLPQPVEELLEDHE